MCLLTRQKFKCHYRVFTNMIFTLIYVKRCILVLTVINIFFLGTYGQSHHFAGGRLQRNYQQFYTSVDSVPKPADVNLTNSNKDLDGNVTNATTVQNSNPESSSELSQAAMEFMTMVWYVATFLAIAAFFMLMACSDRRCTTTTTIAVRSATESIIHPATPTPSYSEFAPPSYDSVMNALHEKNSSVFVIPYDVDKSPKHHGDTNCRTDSPPINVCNVNELQKHGC